MQEEVLLLDNNNSGYLSSDYSGCGDSNSHSCCKRRPLIIKSRILIGSYFKDFDSTNRKLVNNHINQLYY